MRSIVLGCFTLVFTIGLAASEEADHHFDTRLSDDVVQEAWFASVDKQEPLVGYITHDNGRTFGSTISKYVLDTVIGEIIVQIDRTPNQTCNPGCPDRVSVLALPEGYAAVPMSYETPENSIFNIEIFKYNGT